MTRITVSAIYGGLFASTLLAGQAGAQTLTMWGPERISDPQVAALWDEIATSFEAAHEGVEVEFMAPTGTISNGAVQAAIQSGAGPDVILTNSGIGRVTTVVDAGLVQPLTADYEGGWNEMIYPWLQDELKSQFGGEIYEVPDGLDTLGIWYHKDMFAEHDWKIPSDWDAFTELMAEIKAEDIQPLVAAPNNTGSAGHLFGAVLQSHAGAEVMGQAVSGEVPWTDERVMAGFQAFANLVEEGYVEPEMAALTFDAGTRLFLTKRAAMFVGGPWFIGIASGADYPLDNLGFAPMPSNLEGEDIPTGGVGWSWMIPANSDQPELAREWITHILSDEVMRLRAEHPTADAIFPRALEGVTPAVPVMSEISAAAEAGVGYNPSVYLPGAAVDTYYQVIQGLIGGQVSPEEGAEQVQSQIDASE